MDTINNPLSAYEVVNSYDEEDLCRILQEYGEETFAKRIAKNIVEHRLKATINTTEDLEKIVFHSYPSKFKKTYRTHPATKTFQAIRIEVNNELKHLEHVLPDALGLLSVKSCLAIISFHSLEDRIVKHFFKAQKADGKFEILTKKPITPSEAELKFNPRSRSWIDFLKDF
jgi:16S rRNA (cytosine1402-N4)-methyltransferase